MKTGTPPLHIALTAVKFTNLALMDRAIEAGREACDRTTARRLNLWGTPPSVRANIPAVANVAYAAASAGGRGLR